MQNVFYKQSLLNFVICVGATAYKKIDKKVDI